VPIRYRRAPDAERRPREGEVETVGELEALVTLGTLAPGDDVALDGVSYQRAERVPELKAAFGQRPSSNSSLAAKVFLVGGVAIAGLVALSLALRAVVFAGKLAFLAALGLGAWWLVRRWLKRS
jgi:hypothetical protein